MSLTYLEELTIRTYNDIGMDSRILFRPPMWLHARRTIARFLACKLDIDDVIYEGMEPCELERAILVRDSLTALRERYGFPGSERRG